MRKTGKHHKSTQQKKICVLDASSGEVTIFTCKTNANPENAVIKKLAETGGHMGDTEWMVVKKLNIED